MPTYSNREIAQRAIRNAVATAGLPSREVRVIATFSDGKSGTSAGVIAFPGGIAEGPFANFLKLLVGCKSFPALVEALRSSDLTLSE